MNSATAPEVSERRCRRCEKSLPAWVKASVCPACMATAEISFRLSIGPNPTTRRPVAEPAAFGDYVLEEEIAHGGMGVVYKARHLSLDRTVAVKLLLLGRYSGAASLQRFRREAQSAGAAAPSGDRRGA